MNVGKIIGIACAIFAGIKSVWALEQISVSENIAAAVSGSKADIGVAYADSSGYWQSNTRKYPLLSVFKLHVAVAVLAWADKENKPLDTLINVSAAEINKDMYSPMLQKYGVENFSLPLRELLRYMVAESDNNACDILIRRLGGIKAVAAYIRKIGLPETEIKVTEAEMNEDVMLQYANRAPLSEIIKLLQLIQNEKLFSAALHKELLKIMTQTSTGADKIKKYLPEEMIVAHKTGSSSRLPNGQKIADNDVAIIKNGHDISYLAVMVADSSSSDKENAETIARIAKALSDSPEN